MKTAMILPAADGNFGLIRSGWNCEEEMFGKETRAEAKKSRSILENYEGEMIVLEMSLAGILKRLDDLKHCLIRCKDFDVKNLNFGTLLEDFEAERFFLEIGRNSSSCHGLDFLEEGSSYAEVRSFGMNSSLHGLGN
jgi:hypothetical protein